MNESKFSKEECEAEKALESKGGISAHYTPPKMYKVNWNNVKTIGELVTVLKLLNISIYIPPSGELADQIKTLQSMNLVYEDTH